MVKILRQHSVIEMYIDGDTSTGARVKIGTDLEYIVSLNEDLKEIRSAKFKENIGPFGENLI